MATMQDRETFGRARLSFAEEADIEVGATDRAEEVEEGDCAEAPSDALAISCDADLRLNWGELDEWLERS